MPQARALRIDKGPRGSKDAQTLLVAMRRLATSVSPSAHIRLFNRILENPANVKRGKHREVGTVSVNSFRVVQEVMRKVCWIVGTNVLSPAALSDQALIGT